MMALASHVEKKSFNKIPETRKRRRKRAKETRLILEN
jgi:hypothetical protein